MGTEAAPQDARPGFQAESTPRALRSCCRLHGQLHKPTGLVKMLGEKEVNLEACHDCRQHQEGFKENLSSRFHEEGQGSFSVWTSLLKRNRQPAQCWDKAKQWVWGRMGCQACVLQGAAPLWLGCSSTFRAFYVVTWTAATSPDLPRRKTKLLYRHKPSALPRCPLVTRTLRPCLHPPIGTL